MTQPIIEFRGVQKAFDDNIIYKDLTLNVYPGETLTIIGGSGVGKSVMLKLLIGLLPYDDGQVRVFGDEVSELNDSGLLKLRSRVAMLFQGAALFDSMTVEDNIMAILEIAEPNKRKRQIRLEELLSEFSIEHIRRASALALSGGERRRAEIARCLAAGPKYVLLDEPFAGVDPIAVGEIRHLVAELKNRGIGVLITDHNVQETLAITDRTYLMFEGKILKSGTAEELAADEQVRRVYLGQNFELRARK